ncbi:MAG: transcriptional regulator [Magnetovibrio sp.]|nr:transcriptional regulator [Magnetovibrio sp.]
MKPIKTEADHILALQRIDELMGAELDTPEGDELDILATLVEVYENKHMPIDPPDPIEAILFRMDQEGMERKDLEPMLGARSRVSEVLTRKRGLSLSMIRSLNENLHIPAEVLIREYQLNKEEAQCS